MDFVVFVIAFVVVIVQISNSFLCLIVFILIPPSRGYPPVPPESSSLFAFRSTPSSLSLSSPTRLCQTWNLNQSFAQLSIKSVVCRSTSLTVARPNASSSHLVFLNTTAPIILVHNCISAHYHISNMIMSRKTQNWVWARCLQPIKFTHVHTMFPPYSKLFLPTFPLFMHDNIGTSHILEKLRTIPPFLIHTIPFIKKKIFIRAYSPFLCNILPGLQYIC